MEQLENWLLAERLQVLPKSTIGKAIFYLIPRFNKIAMYIEDGRLEADNNLVENLIRPVALGRKNYMFAGSHAGARRAVIVYSLLGSCKLQDINPHEYLMDILQRLPLQPVNKLQELLPPFWKPANITPIPQPSYATCPGGYKYPGIPLIFNVRIIYGFYANVFSDVNVKT